MGDIATILSSNGRYQSSDAETLVSAMGGAQVTAPPLPSVTVSGLATPSNTLTATVNNGTATAWKWQNNVSGTWTDIGGETANTLAYSDAYGPQVRPVATISGSPVIGPIANGYRVVGNKHGMTGNASAASGSAFSADSGLTMLCNHKTGIGGGFSSPRIIFTGTQVSAGANAEVNNGFLFNAKPAFNYNSITTQTPFPGAVGAKDILPGDTLTITDPVSVTVPDSVTFNTRVFRSVLAGSTMTLSGRQDNISKTTGNVATGTPGTDIAYATTAGANGPITTPDAVIGLPTDYTAHKAVYICGMSLCSGTFDSLVEYIGMYERALTRDIAWTNCSKHNSNINNWLTSSPNLRKLAQYCTSAIMDRTTNDIYNDGTGLASTQSRWLAIGTILASLVQRGAVFGATVTPRVTNASLTNAGGQTISNSAQNTVRINFNNWMRAGAPIDPTTKAAVAIGTSGALLMGAAGHPYRDYFEMANQVEVDATNTLTQDGGRWYCGPGNDTAYSADGTHGNALGYALLAGGVILSKLV